jgi:hypothetical protein
MPCAFYRHSPPGNPLRVCSSKNRVDLAPSFAHLKLFCLSISAYRKCPMYKRKTSNSKGTNRCYRLLKQSARLLVGQGK